MQRKIVRVMIVIAVAFAAGHLVQNMKTRSVAEAGVTSGSDLSDRILHVTIDEANPLQSPVSVSATTAAAHAASMIDLLGSSTAVSERQ